MTGSQMLVILAWIVLAPRLHPGTVKWLVPTLFGVSLLMVVLETLTKVYS